MTTIEKEVRPWTLTLLLACGVAGPLLFIVAFLIEGAFRPNYSAWHMVVSSLSAGPGGWTQITNFIVSGLLVLCFSSGLKRVLKTGKGSKWGPILLGVFGLSLVGAGVFVTDPGLGYPSGVATPAVPSVHGSLHNLLSLFVFAALIAACFVLAPRFRGDPDWRGWSLYSILSGALVLIFFILTGVIASAMGPGSPAGIAQRTCIIIGWVWIALLAWKLMRSGSPAA